MKTKKKILSFLLVISLILQLIPVSAFASTTTTSPENMDPNSVEYRNWKDSVGSAVLSTTTSAAISTGTSTTTPFSF